MNGPRRFITPMLIERCLAETDRSGQYLDISAEVAMTALVAVRGICENPPSLMEGQNSSRRRGWRGGSVKVTDWIWDRDRKSVV